MRYKMYMLLLVCCVMEIGVQNTTKRRIASIAQEHTLCVTPEDNNGSQAIADQLSRRGSYKRLMKKYGYAAMKAGAKGIKICCSGRLAGAEIARVEWLRLGSVPLHTIRANISYTSCDSDTTYGKIGVKVWICKGEYQ